jgi:hypothetical protein
VIGGDKSWGAEMSGSHWTSPEFVDKGTWISFQNGPTRIINLRRMLRGIEASLTLAFWATCCAQSKALAIQFEATGRMSETAQSSKTQSS